MKMYNNGPRKAMMYGGMSKRKPMMYGGMATTKKKKTRKKAQAGGMMTATQGQQNQMQNQTMQKPKMPMMAGGGKTMVEMNGKMVPDYAADGKGKNDLRKKMNEGGMARKFSALRGMIGKGGKSVSDKDVERLMGLKALKTLSDQDRALIVRLLQEAREGGRTQSDGGPR